MRSSKRPGLLTWRSPGGLFVRSARSACVLFAAVRVRPLPLFRLLLLVPALLQLPPLAVFVQQLQRLECIIHPHAIWPNVGSVM